MDWLTKQKTYLILIIILIVINVSVLVILWLGRSELPKRFPQNPQNVNMFLQKELGLNEKQDDQLKQIRQNLFDSTNIIDKQIWIKKRELQDEAFKENPDSLKVNVIIMEISALQSQVEKYMFKHFSSIKNILNDDQILKFKKLLDQSGMRKHEPRDGERQKQLPPPPSRDMYPPDH